MGVRNLNEWLRGVVSQMTKKREPVGRNPITVMSFPEKFTVEEFIEEITDPEINQSFINNMNNLEQIPEERYPEDWIQTYAAWMEMNK